MAQYIHDATKLTPFLKDAKRAIPTLARPARSSLRCGLRGKPSPTTRTRIEILVEVAPWLKWTHGKRRRTASEQSELHLIHYIAKRLLTYESSGLRLRTRAGF